jgi:type IV pilus assembly protein PilV
MIRKNFIHRQQGFTLLESLIALVVLSVGMLGIAALYVEGLKAGRTAVYRTTAVALAAGMMDRVRANPAGRDDYALDGVTADCVNGGVDCTSTELAQEDRLVWETEVAERMPTGVAAVVTVTLGDPFDTYAISVSWPEPGYAENLNYTLTAQM